MNWDAIGAIGELVGAVAVVATLIYFAQQIRGSSRDSAAEYFTANQAIQADITKLTIDHAELLTRANRNEELSDAERLVFTQLVRHFAGSYFRATRRAQTLGLVAAEQAQLTSFASFLHGNAAARSEWVRAEKQARNNRVAMGMVGNDDFRPRIEALLNRLDAAARDNQR